MPAHFVWLLKLVHIKLLLGNEHTFIFSTILSLERNQIETISGGKNEPFILHIRHSNHWYLGPNSRNNLIGAYNAIGSVICSQLNFPMRSYSMNGPASIGSQTHVCCAFWYYGYIIIFALVNHARECFFRFFTSRSSIGPCFYILNCIIVFHSSWYSYKLKLWCLCHSATQNTS